MQQSLHSKSLRVGVVRHSIIFQVHPSGNPRACLFSFPPSRFSIVAAWVKANSFWREKLQVPFPPSPEIEEWRAREGCHSSDDGWHGEGERGKCYFFPCFVGSTMGEWILGHRVSFHASKMCLLNSSRKNRKPNFFTRAFICGGETNVAIIWYRHLEESPLCSSKKSLTISTRKERKKGGGKGGLEEKSKSSRVNQEALLCRRRKFWEGKKAHKMLCSVSFFCRRDGEGNENSWYCQCTILGRRLAYWPPQKATVSQKRGFETVFSFLFRCPEPRRRTTGNRGYKRGPTFSPLLLLLFWSYRPISSFRAKTKNVIG